MTTNAAANNNMPIRAEISGSDRCDCEGFSVRNAAPVLAMCKKLIEAGFDPCRPLEAWRGATLCIKIRSIGEGSRLVYLDGGGFYRKVLAAKNS